MVFWGGDTSGQGGIWTNAGGTVHKLLDSSGPFASFSSPTINASGLISFQATSDDSTNGIYTIDLAGHLTTISASKTQSFVLGASINDSGRLAFYVHNADGTVGIYTGADPVADKVLASGDHLFGLAVTNVAVFNHALNNGGQIALRASLSDGNTYLVLATPAQPGDATLDGHVDLNDLNTVLNNLGATTSAWTSGNFDGAVTINLNDLNDVLNNLGVSYAGNASVIAAESLVAGGTAAPEPASLALISVGAIPPQFIGSLIPRAGFVGVDFCWGCSSNSQETTGVKGWPGVSAPPRHARHPQMAWAKAPAYAN